MHLGYMCYMHFVPCKPCMDGCVVTHEIPGHVETLDKKIHPAKLGVNVAPIGP